MFSVVKPNLLIKELNFEFSPPLKNSNSNVASDFSVLPTFSTNSSMSRFRSLKVSALSLVVSSTSGKILLSSCDRLCPVGERTAFFSVIEIALFFSSVMSVIGLEKLFIFGLETLSSGDKKTCPSRG